MRILVKGGVQGVGFRPFVYRLARSLGLSGWVCNSGSGVTIEIQGPEGALMDFTRRLLSEAPPSASPEIESGAPVTPAGIEAGFEIRLSEGGSLRAVVQPDLATCGDCLAEVFDPSNRRYLYPFTNCTNCGPRFSIILSLPYDRSRTTMSVFRMCDACRSEYEDPMDRRFHAQPNACPVCGPRLELLDGRGGSLAKGHDALSAAAGALKDGLVVAVKGIGGFHLMAKADMEEPLARLRQRKHRPSKPFAMMVPDVASASALCEVSESERMHLESPRAPIVLLRRRAEHASGGTCDLVAPGNPRLGIMLPHSPHQHLLMRETGFPVVATSGNLAEEPVCTDNGQALERLAGIADLFLVHDRPIARHLDDSIVTVLEDGETVLRRSRGYAPLPVRIPGSPVTVLALGAHLKNTVTLAVDGQAFVSQHIGDMDTAESAGAFERVIQSLCGLYEAKPEVIATDMHPDYYGTRAAPDYGGKLFAVQHHCAHVYSCMAENGLEGPVLGVAWDGTGYGPDGTVWGGEFIVVEKDGAWRRVARLRQFRLPGGDKAVMEPRRSAAGVLAEMRLDPRCLPPAEGSFTPRESAAIAAMLESHLNSPLTSSCGRLFDAVASLAGVCQASEFEGQAAMGLEFAAEGFAGGTPYRMVLGLGSSPAVLDWEPAVRQILDDLERGAKAPEISSRFHDGLAECIVEVARHVGIRRVALSGGCFQNRLLVTRASRRLREEGFEVFRHSVVPPNDGGISLGQAFAAGLAAGAQEV